MNKLKIIHVKKHKITDFELNNKPLIKLIDDAVGYEFIDKGVGCCETGTREMYLNIKKLNGEVVKFDVDEVEYKFMK